MQLEYESYLSQQLIYFFIQINKHHCHLFVRLQKRIDAFIESVPRAQTDPFKLFEKNWPASIFRPILITEINTHFSNIIQLRLCLLACVY